MKFDTSSSVFQENISFNTIIKKYTPAIQKNKFFKSRAILIILLWIPFSHHLEVEKSLSLFSIFFR
ncbi:hypothetical protein HOG21_08440 [bacterium]|nr:hypothetical protein [bacterium]